MQFRSRSSHDAGDAPTLARPAALDLLCDRRRLLLGTAGLALGSFGGVQTASARRLGDMVEIALANLTMRERVAQMFMFYAAGTGMTDGFERSLERVKPGGILVSGPNIAGARDVRRFASLIHRTNRELPPLIAIDQEGGQVVRLPDDPAPGALELGRMSDRHARAKAKQRARFLDEHGIDVNFAPVADVAHQPSSAMATRSFGSDPRAVARTVAAVVRGTQDGRVLAAAKHFPGHGRTQVDSHLAVPEVDLSWKAWRQSDGRPFRSAVDAGVDMVMFGHLRYSDWDDAPATLSKVAVRALRKDLGFRGVIVTDDLGMGALDGLDPIRVLDRAAAAGVDLFLHPATMGDWPDLVDHLFQRYRKGKVSKQRIDASVRRIVALKIRRFDLNPRSER